MAPKRRKLNSRQAASSPPMDSPPETEPTQPTHEEPPSLPEPAQQEFTLPFPDKPEKSISCIRYSAPGRGDGEAVVSARARLVFTHGAGGGLESAAMQDFSRGFARVAQLVCFQGTLHMGNRVKAFRAVVENEGSGPGRQSKAEGGEQGESVALGGRSMGARAAAMLAAAPEYEGRVEALVLVSFPLVSAKGERREEVLLGVSEGVDVLFISGDRDGMCDLADLQEVMGRMECKTWLVVVEGADHGMKLGKKGGAREVGERTGEIAARWLEERDQQKKKGSVRWDAEESKVVEDGWRKD